MHSLRLRLCEISLCASPSVEIAQGLLLQKGTLRTGGLREVQARPSALEALV